MTLVANQIYGINTDSVIKFSKWDIGISFSPDYSYRILTPIGSSYSGSDLGEWRCADSLNSIEKATIAWTVGIPITYHFNKYMSLRTGINLSDKTIKSKGFVWTNGVYSEFWTVFKSDKWEKENFYFLEVPLALQFTYRPKKFNKINISFMGGATICTNINEHYYNSRKYETDLNYSHPELESSYTPLYVDKFKLLYIGYTFGLKITYKLNDKFLLGLEPVYKYYGKEFISPSPDMWGFNNGKISRQIMGITEKPYSYGINLTLEFSK